MLRKGLTKDLKNGYSVFTTFLLMVQNILLRIDHKVILYLNHYKSNLKH